MILQNYLRESEYLLCPHDDIPEKVPLLRVGARDGQASWGGWEAIQGVQTSLPSAGGPTALPGGGFW